MRKLIICLCLTICHIFYSPLFGKEGIDNAIKVNLSGKIYKQLSFLVTEDLRTDIDFSNTSWLFSTLEFNYRITPWLKTGLAYGHILNTHESQKNKNRYIIYITAEKKSGHFNFSFRERFQSTYTKGSNKPNNALRACVTVKYKIGKTPFTPFVFVETFNNPYHAKMDLNKIRFSTGCNYSINKKNKIQLSYRYHIFYKEENINYQNNLGLSYTHSF